MRFLHKKLDQRKESGTLRSLKPFSGEIDFYSNDYLGLCTDARIHVRARQLLADAGLTGRNGSAGSRLLSGNFPFYEDTESFLAQFYGAESALIFHSGYTALLGTLSCLPGRTDTVLYDELVHASARDGIRLSPAKNHAFGHNDLADLEAKLQNAQGNVFVVVESLYSMDGDTPPLAEMARLQQQYGFVWVIDEAHAGGVYGEQGRGLTHELGRNENVIRIVTFGKAYGTEGACVLGSALLREYLVNFSRPFIYTTAPAPEFYAKIRASAETASTADTERGRLFQNIRHFGDLFEKHFACTGSPIQVYQPGNVERLQNITRRAAEAGISVRPIYSPTVPEGKERLRIVLHAYNTHEEIQMLYRVLSA